MWLTPHKSTELAMMQDTSSDYKSTWDFLDRRFEDVHDLSAVVKGSRPEDVTKVISSLGTTFKAIVGLPR